MSEQSRAGEFSSEQEQERTQSKNKCTKSYITAIDNNQDQSTLSSDSGNVVVVVDLVDRMKGKVVHQSTNKTDLLLL